MVIAGEDDPATTDVDESVQETILAEDLPSAVGAGIPFTI